MANTPLNFTMTKNFGKTSSESKRKHNLFEGFVDLRNDSSLVLGLGCSSSSCITIFSGKEIDEESSISLGLSIDLNSRIDLVSPTKDNFCGVSNPLEAEKAKIDLELSLSACPPESEVTGITQGSMFFESIAEPIVSGSKVQLVDEGSTSARWKLGPLLTPLQTVPNATPLDLITTNINPSPIISNSLVSQSQHLRRSGNTKMCQFDGCTKGARGASGLCIAHGGGRRCQREWCQKGAEGKTVFCKAHGGGRRCEHLGCTKSAEGRTDYCIGHGGGRRCHEEGCGRAARGKSGLCIRHGGGKRCKIDTCKRSAEGISGLCISHGGGRRCQFPECKKGAQGSTFFCKAHGGGKRCTFLGCTKGAEGSTLFCKGHGGGKRCTFKGGCDKSIHGGTLFCVRHGGGKRCKQEGCMKSARGKTDFCVRHGGGRRCKNEGCTKSAQGSTDFCKAHGGGKRCTMGMSPCNKFARGKSGLCTLHCAMIEDTGVSNGAVISGLVNPQMCSPEKMKGFASCDSHTIGSVGTGQFSLPEGRVHGGSLMAMLGGSSSSRPSSSCQVQTRGDAVRQGKDRLMPPHEWM